MKTFHCPGEEEEEGGGGSSSSLILQCWWKEKACSQTSVTTLYNAFKKPLGHHPWRQTSGVFSVLISSSHIKRKTSPMIQVTNLIIPNSE